MGDSTRVDERGERADGKRPWTAYFGFDEPYRNQADAIETAIETARDGGFLAMEGPCGTGKTMAALTAAAYVIRETDRYENAMVVTPVKQQRAQFVEDLRTINAGIDDPLTGIALVGKRDLCPYGRADAFPEGKSVQSRCEDLRETTAELVAEDGELEVNDEFVHRTEEQSDAREADEEQWWDPAKARTLVKAAQSENSGSGELQTAGRTAPYPRSQPATTPEMTDSGTRRLYCPFEADWYARDKASPVTFEAGENAVLTTEEYLPEAVDLGICPHRAMMVLLREADVVIGNYNHLFDTTSRALTAPILDETTLLIVDEAHRMEERIRDLLTDTIGYGTIKRAKGDLDGILERARRTTENKRAVERALGKHELSLETVETARELYDDTLEWLEARVDDELRDRVDGYGTWFVENGFDDEGETGASRGEKTERVGRTEQRERAFDDAPGDDRLEIQLRDPTEAQPDEFTRWAEANGYGETIFRSLPTVGKGVEAALEELGSDRDGVCTAVGTLFSQWWTRNHVEYFREIELERTGTDRRDVDAPWLRHYNASMVMYNCMPSGKIRDILDDLGGGMLMSATLEPLSIFETVTGIRDLGGDEPARQRADGSNDEATGNEADGSNDEATGNEADNSDASGVNSDNGATDEEPSNGVAEPSRPVVSQTYDLPFPEENRASWIVDVESFTKRNRGETTVGNRNRTRDRYAYVAQLIAESYGNILLAWPNYAEAEWAATRLRETVDKPVFLDQSSNHEETEELKREFVSDEPSVLVTSTRGTLTEGVDYEGEDLHACAVFGVPLVNIGSPRVQAVKHAYGDRFGEENAFTYALTIPAVRQVRQALGRVIRGPEECGVRIVVGNRFVPDAVHSVYEHFPTTEREEFVQMTPMFLESQFESFWNDRSPRGR